MQSKQCRPCTGRIWNTFRVHKQVGNIPMLLQDAWTQLQVFLELQGVSDPRCLDLTLRLQRLCQQQLVQLGVQPQPPE